MKYRKTVKLMNKILKNEPYEEIGLFISLLSSIVIERYGVSKQQFLKSLKNSLNDIEKVSDKE